MLSHQPRYYEMINWNSLCDSWFTVDPGKSIYLNTSFDVFLFIQNDLYVNKARGIILGIINVNMHRAGIEIMILTKCEIFIDVIFVILFL